MSGPAAAHLLEDPFGFARAAGQQGGQAAISVMSRLQDRLADNEGSVSYIVRGGHDQRERPQLELEIAGKLRLHCARCMAPLDYALALRSRVLMAQTGAAPQDDDDPEAPEWIEVGQELDLLELVEDEILLGLPLSVRHDQGKCSSGDAGGHDEKTTDSPFARLATLLEPGRTNKR